MNVPSIYDTERYQILSVSGTYICPPGCKYIHVEAVGAGGSGARTIGLVSGGSGGSGGYFKKYYTAANYAYTIGTGGAGIVTLGGIGAVGGGTVFNVDTAGGGAGGALLTGGVGGIVTITSALLSRSGITGLLGTKTAGSVIFGTEVGSGGFGAKSTDLGSTAGKNGLIIVTEFY